jgi:hypothetical protein
MDLWDALIDEKEPVAQTQPAIPNRQPTEP